MGRQLSVERKSRREINKTMREEGWEGVPEEDGGEAAFTESLDYMGAGNGPHNPDSVSDLFCCLVWQQREEKGEV